MGEGNTGECKHIKWLIDRHNIGTCVGTPDDPGCGEARQFPLSAGGQVIVLKKGNPTSKLLGKEEHMDPHKQERHKYYEENKEAIIADLFSLGRVATRAKWNIPKGSLGKLERQWLTEEQRLKLSVNLGTPPGTPGETPHPSTNSTPSNGRLPPFPQFSDTWEPEVQLQWLEVYEKLTTKVQDKQV